MSVNYLSTGPISFEKRIVRQYLDIIILSLANGNGVNGYEIIRLVNERFQILLSAGTVYSLLNSLERTGFLESNSIRHNREYKLTKEGLTFLKSFQTVKQRMLAYIDKLF